MCTQQASLGPGSNIYHQNLTAFEFVAFLMKLNLTFQNQTLANRSPKFDLTTIGSKPLLKLLFGYPVVSNLHSFGIYAYKLSFGFVGTKHS